MMLLRGFLNRFLSDSYGTITKADVLNTELIKDATNGETYLLDFLIKTNTGLLINLEMQQFWQASYPKRIQMYSYRVASRFLKLHSAENEPTCAISLTFPRWLRALPEILELKTARIHST